MKKVLLSLATVALLFTACSDDSKEILLQEQQIDMSDFYVYTDFNDDLSSKSVNSKESYKTCYTMDVLNKQLRENPGLEKKMFDIEYQTYGWVNSERHMKSNESHFHWMHPDQPKCLTVAFVKTNQTFLGINTFGIRMRHEIFNRWLDQNKTIDYVLEHLEIAHFDPEFYKTYYNQVIKKYNTENNSSLQLKKKNWSQIFTLKS